MTTTNSEQKKAETPSQQLWNKEYAEHNAIPSTHRDSPSQILEELFSGYDFDNIDKV